MTLNKPKIFRDIDTINVSLGEKAYRTVICPLEFNAVGNGVADDTQALIDTFNYAHNNKCVVDLMGLSYKFSSNITITDITVKNGTLYRQSFRINVYGKCLLDNVTIIADEAAYAGYCLDLYNNDNTTINNCVLYGGIRSQATRCNNLRLKDSILHFGNYGLLLNEINNSGLSCKGLYIDNCEFIVVNSQQNGDCIEVNTPTYRFQDVFITNCKTYASVTQTGTSGAIGFGFAQCDNVHITNCFFDTIGNVNGMIHCEWCTKVFIRSNTLLNCTNSSIWVLTSDFVDISDNYIDGCKYGICLISDFKQQTYFTIRNNTILNFTIYGIYGNKAIHFTIENNKILYPKRDINITDQKVTYIFFYDSGNSLSLDESVIRNNEFHWVAIDGVSRNLYIKITTSVVDGSATTGKFNKVIDNLCVGSTDNYYDVNPTYNFVKVLADKDLTGFVEVANTNFFGAPTVTNGKAFGFDLSTGDIYRRIGTTWTKTGTFGTAI